jgi:lipopolysaccharide/colanic/teichoic acid biosynthesis glycosyltransferase
MNSRIYRFCVIIVLITFLSVGFKFIQEWMAVIIEYHSWIHYLVRFMAVIAVLFGITLAIRIFSAQIPSYISIRMDRGFNESKRFKKSNLVKRFLDILIAYIGIVILAPIFVLVSTLIYIFEGLPIFYISRRYIFKDLAVPVLKFRTMVKDALSTKYQLDKRFMKDGYLDIPLDCEVYTPIGRFLEKTQLVESLQLFNIILHGMSIVGSRPLPLKNINILKKYEGWDKRYDSPAGITGIAQIVGKQNLTPSERLNLECLYTKLYHDCKKNILVCDALIIYYTIRLAFTGKSIELSKAKKIVNGL